MRTITVTYLQFNGRKDIIKPNLVESIRKEMSILMSSREMFDTLLRPMEDLLLNVIHGKVKNREISKEIYHNVIVLGLSKFYQLQDTNKFPAWIFAITRNEIAAYIKKQKRKNSYELPVDLQDPLNAPLLYSHSKENVEEAVVDRSEIEQLRNAVSGLDDTDKLIIWMAYYQEMSLSEVADTLNMSLGAVKMRKKRALNKLRKNINL